MRRVTVVKDIKMETNSTKRQQRGPCDALIQAAVQSILNLKCPCVAYLHKQWFMKECFARFKGNKRKLMKEPLFSCYQNSRKVRPEKWSIKERINEQTRITREKLFSTFSSCLLGYFGLFLWTSARSCRHGSQSLHMLTAGKSVTNKFGDIRLKLIQHSASSDFDFSQRSANKNWLWIAVTISTPLSLIPFPLYLN